MQRRQFLQQLPCPLVLSLRRLYLHFHNHVPVPILPCVEDALASQTELRPVLGALVEFSKGSLPTTLDRRKPRRRRLN